MVLILPVAITTAFGTASTLVKAVLLKYSNTNKLVYTYISYFVVFAICSFSLSKLYGLLGFAIANLICNVILWGLFIILLITSSPKKQEVKDGE